MSYCIGYGQADAHVEICLGGISYQNTLPDKEIGEKVLIADRWENTMRNSHILPNEEDFEEGVEDGQEK